MPRLVPNPRMALPAVLGWKQNPPETDRTLTVTSYDPIVEDEIDAGDLAELGAPVVASDAPFKRAFYLPEDGTLERMIHDLGPSFYWPGTGPIADIDVGGSGATLTRLNGAAYVDTAAAGLSGGLVALDGVNDYLSTTAATRRNLILNPGFETNTTRWQLVPNWSGDWSATTALNRTAAWAHDGTYSAHFKLTKAATTTPAVASFQTIPETMPVTAGQSYTLSMRANILDNAAQGIVPTIVWRDAANAEVPGSRTSGTAVTGTGLQTLSVTGTAPALATQVGVKFFVNSNVSGDVFEAYFDAALFERTAYAGAYFPTVAQLADGTAGWTGTAYDSASEIGPFANGTVRTFLTVARRNTIATTDALFSGSGQPRTFLYGAAGVETMIFNANTAAGGVAWGSVLPAGVPRLVGVEFNEPTKAVKLYRDGAFVSQQTETQSYANVADRNLTLGYAPAVGVHQFDGHLGHMAVFNRALTAAEHAALGAKFLTMLQ